MPKNPKNIKLADLTFAELLQLLGVWSGQEINNSYLYDSQIVGGDIIESRYRSVETGARVEIRPTNDNNIGLVVYDADENKVFETIIDGTNVGDVNIGGANGISWDKSAGAMVGLPKIGDWADKLPDTIYQAATDGFVYAEGSAADTLGSGLLDLFVGSSSPPTTLRGRIYIHETYTLGVGFFIFPIKKNDYWEVNDDADTLSSMVVKWLPLG